MKATDVCTELKALLGVRRNEEIAPAVRGLLDKRKPRQPTGVLLVLDEGTYYPTVVGMRQPTLGQVEALREACLHFSETQLGKIGNVLREREIEARVRAELRREAGGEGRGARGEGRGARGEEHGSAE
jgi:hypothetical protein